MSVSVTQNQAWFFKSQRALAQATKSATQSAAALPLPGLFPTNAKKKEKWQSAHKGHHAPFPIKSLRGCVALFFAHSVPVMQPSYS